MRDFLKNLPGGFLGALGLLSLTTNLLEFEGYIADSIAAYQFFSRFFWSSTLGWYWDFVGFRLSDFAQDYLSLGVIVYLSLMRGFYSVSKPVRIKHPEEKISMFPKSILTLSPIMVVLWPLVVSTVILLPRIFAQYKRQNANLLKESGISQEVQSDVPQKNPKVMERLRTAFFGSVIIAIILIAINYAAAVTVLK